jgi:phosphoribosylglycinamide formyltransferase-1
MADKRIAVFISGRGSNFMSIHRSIEKGDIRGGIVCVISDQPGAAGLEYARGHGLESAVFRRVPGEERTGYFERVMRYLEDRNIDLVVLAGFMKVLSPTIISRYRHRILNIHPALLPSFPGTDAQAQALDYGVKYTGCTVHFVDEGVDTGPIVLQAVVPVKGDDNVQTLSQRILEQEHRVFPEAVRLFCEDRLQVEGRKVRTL